MFRGLTGAAVLLDTTMQTPTTHHNLPTAMYKLLLNRAMGRPPWRIKDLLKRLIVTSVIYQGRGARGDGVIGG